MTIISVDDSLNPAYLAAAINDGNSEKNFSAVTVFALNATFLVILVYYIIVDYARLYRSLHSSKFKDSFGIRTVKLPTDAVTRQDDWKVVVDGTQRGDKQPPTTSNSIATKQSYSVKSFDDGIHLNENTFRTSGYYTASSNYSDYSYKSKIVGGGNVKPVPLTRSMLQGTESVADKGYDVHRHTVKKSQEASPQVDREVDCHNRSFQEAPHTSYNFSESSALKVKYPPNGIGQNEDSHAYTQKDLELPLHKESETQNTGNEVSKRQSESNELVKPSQEKVPSTYYMLPEPKKSSTGYSKSTYAVLIGNNVKVYSTNTFASFPHNNKFLVKERHQDSSGITRVKLTLKSTERERYIILNLLLYTYSYVLNMHAVN